MAEFDLSITSLFVKAFGIGRGRNYDGDQLRKSDNEKVSFTFDKDGQPQITSPEFESDAIPGASSEGTEFINMRDTIQAKDILGRPLFMPVQINGVLLPNEPTMAISVNKKIVSTPLVGSKRKGTVKELISVEDYSIVIRGVALNYDSTFVYPEDEVKILHDLFLKDQSLEVKSAVTNLLGIYRLVIKDFKLPEMIGVQHAQAYEFICVSDEDFVLTID
ncbi:MAG: DUF6046 domain-containing protein [Bacteroidota bacterium]